MILLEKSYAPGAVTPEAWDEVDCAELQIVAWPGRDILLLAERAAGGRQISIINPEPGMRIRTTDPEGNAQRLRLSTRQSAAMFSSLQCLVRIIEDPLEVMVEQPKQEAQGISLTRGTAVTVATATEGSLGEFRAWRTGVVRTVGTVSADPTSLNFYLRSLYSSGGVVDHLVGNTGTIPHRLTTWEYSMRSGAATFLVPVVHAGRYYRLSVEHGDGGSLDFEADLYIEPVDLK